MGKSRNREKEYNIHHGIGVCNSRMYNVQLDINKQLVEVLDHQALNKIVGETQEPQGQMRIMANKFGRYNIMSDEAKELFELLTTLDPKIFYKKELIKNR